MILPRQFGTPRSSVQRLIGNGNAGLIKRLNSSKVSSCAVSFVAWQRDMCHCQP